MSEPAGRVVGKVPVVRGCGCTQDIDRFDRDRFFDQRLDKLKKTRCPACVTKHAAEQKQAASLPKRGEAVAALPPGAAVSLTKRPDSIWAGTLTAGGVTVEAVGESPVGVTVALAQRWVVANKPK